MKDYILLNYDFLFNDHLAKCSHEAKLYYIKLMFFANNGFVANPKQVLDSLGYEIGVLYELIASDELLTIPGREEMFITSYFIHTKFNPMSWLSTPFAIYWKGKLWMKKNGIATLKKQQEEQEDPIKVIKPPEASTGTNLNWDEMIDDLDGIKK